jgi:hypothetical protein
VTEHYVTLFDSLFLPQGLALQTSMERFAGDYQLWVLCVDDETYEILTNLNLPNVRLLLLSELETEELQKVKSTRTIGEYCWTLTPFAPRFVFESDTSVERVTYIDADVWFLGSPAPIFRELDSSGKSILITDHAYAPEFDQSATSGRYCVQFMPFRRDGSEHIRKWWEDRCIEWCYGRLEAGKFGDQKYLDDWAVRFAESVHVLQDKELMLAPWNATRFPYGSALLYHFHGLRIVSSVYVEIGNYPVPRVVMDNVYRPYLVDLRTAIMSLESVQVPARIQGRPVGAVRRLLRSFRRFQAQAAWRFDARSLVRF